MRREFSQFIGLPYQYDNGPLATTGKQDIAHGLNCQLLVHLVYQNFGINLPPHMLSKEIFEDESLFAKVTDPKTMRILDVVIFGPENVKDTRRFHLAVCTGEIDKTADNSFLIHANSIEGEVSVWPLEKFSSKPQYRRIYAIKRCKLNERN
jgi:hypothetical protein